jgi:hypothetical protein
VLVGHLTVAESANSWLVAKPEVTLTLGGCCKPPCGERFRAMPAWVRRANARIAINPRIKIGFLGTPIARWGRAQGPKPRFILRRLRHG